jgi:peptidyl-prolyl cis-trans isomerase B (cyclophilin B)
MSETTPAYTPAPAAKTNVLAIVSLVTSILGISLVGVITGHIGLSQIKKTGESGRGLGIAGLIIGYLALAAALIIGVVVVLGVAVGAGNANFTTY